MIHYQSDDDEHDVHGLDQDEIASKCCVKTRKRGQEYRFSETFETGKQIKMDDFWAKSVSQQTNHGFKQFYYCCLDRNNCPKRCVFIYDDKTDNVHLHDNLTAHNHVTEKRGLKDEQKDFKNVFMLRVSQNRL